MFKNRMTVLIATGGLLVATAGAAIYANANKVSAQAAGDADGDQARQGPPPATVYVTEAISTQLAPLSEAPGSIVSTNDSLVAAATSGKIEWVAEIGAEVAKGDVIAKIDAADATFTRDESNTEISRLGSRANYLSRLVERYEGLGDDAGESEASLDEMRSNRDEARQNLQRARVALRRAEVNLERTQVKAPFAGRLVSRETQIGEYATPGSPIARLVDTHTLEVTAQAPAGLLANTKVGDEITVAYGAENIKALVRTIVPVGDEISRTMEIRLALPDTGWHIGSAVRVSLPASSRRTVIAADRDALVLRANRISVFVIDEENKAKQIDVELGAADGDIIELIGDVKAGDKLVVRGGERLRDGQTVDVQEKEIVSALIDNETNMN